MKNILVLTYRYILKTLFYIQMESDSLSPISGSGVSFWIKKNTDSSNDTAPLNPVPLNRTSFIKLSELDPNCHIIVPSEDSNSSVFICSCRY